MSMMKKIIRIAISLCLCLGLCLGAVQSCFADSPTDEILSYTITADINEDASVNLYYHLQWKVLESDGIGPVEWVTIGAPNGHINSIQALTDNIDSAYEDSGSGSNIRIDFNKSYYEGEVIDFEYMIQADYMYQMDSSSGESVYYFTPGWFDSIQVDSLEIRWNADKASSWSGGALQKGDYLTWSTSLDAGETVSIQVNYPDDAFAFTQYSNDYNESSQYNDGYSSSGSFGLFDLIGILFSFMPFIIFAIIFITIARNAKKAYEKGAGFAEGETKTKVTRTKVVYYDTCPGCGAPRGEGKEVCEFCGRSLIKSEEVIKEEEVKDEDKDALKYDKKGTYHYGTDPNTFVRVNVVHIPIVSTRPVMHGGMAGGGPRGGHGGGSRGGGRPSCAHSSCACACVSCACACACACAGGGRAGCSVKDLYSSKLKATQIKRRSKQS